MTLLERLRQRYETIRTRLDEITNAAAADGEHGRSLNDAESAEIRTLTDEATALVPQIESEVARHWSATRRRRRCSARVSVSGPGANTGARGLPTRTPEPARDPAADVTLGVSAGADGADDDASIRSQVQTGNAQTRERDPGIYVRSATIETGEHRGERAHSFFHDLVHASEGDTGARERLGAHHRALSNASQGAGLVPPVWLATEFEYLARQGRQISDIVRHYPLGNDPRPITLPRQTAGTDSVIAQVTPENTHPSETNGINTTTDVVTPIPTSGIQVVSRQMIDMDDPSIDAFVYGDMLSVYNTKVEAQVCAAMVTAAGSAVTTYASDATNFTASAAEDGVTDAAFGVWNARKLPADIVAMRVLRWGKFNKFRDTSGSSALPDRREPDRERLGQGQRHLPGFGRRPAGDRYRRAGHLGLRRDDPRRAQPGHDPLRGRHHAVPLRRGRRSGVGQAGHLGLHGGHGSPDGELGPQADDLGRLIGPTSA
jgi:hypothetical protein